MSDSTAHNIDGSDLVSIDALYNMLGDVKWAMVRVPVLLWHNVSKFRECQMQMYNELQNQMKMEGVKVHSIKFMMDRRALKHDHDVCDEMRKFWEI